MAVSSFDVPVQDRAEQAQRKEPLRGRKRLFSCGRENNEEGEEKGITLPSHGGGKAKAAKDEWVFNLCGVSISKKCGRSMLKKGK